MNIDDYLKSNNKKKSSFFNKLFHKVCITTILVLSALIGCRESESFNNFIDKYVYKNNFNFSKINNLYNKYILKLKNETIIEVSTNNLLEYSYKEDYSDGGVKLSVGSDYPVKMLESGLILYVGEKDGMSSIVVEQANGLEVTYMNVVTTEIKIYDYIEKGSIIGSSNDYLYLIFRKNGEVIDYNPYI